MNHVKQEFIGKNGVMGYRRRMKYHKHMAHQRKLQAQEAQNAGDNG